MRVAHGQGAAKNAETKAEPEAVRWQDQVYDLLRRHDVTQFAYLPDAGHRLLIDRSLADLHVHCVALTMEEEGVAMLAGARARRDRRVMVLTGDGELLMNLGALATIAGLDPPNLSILVVDNGHCGETGHQKSHTNLGVDLEKIAVGSGIKRTATAEKAADLASGARLLREGNGTAYVLLRVKPTEPPAVKRDLDPARCRVRFKLALPAPA